MSDYDLVVLGAGATGLGAARTARQAGRRVALVEADRPGGDCTHYGCVPSKALLEAGHRVHAARSGPDYGFTAHVEVDLVAVLDRVRRVVAEIEQDESPELLARQGIDLLPGWGTFLGPHELEVEGRRITAERFVVATGSRSVTPPVPGLDEVPFLDNRTIFSLTEAPEHLLVLGGGAIGVELSQAFSRLGVRVTVVELAPRLLSKEEPEASAVVTERLRRDGVDVRTGVGVARVSAGPVLHLEDGSTVRGSHLLVAVGRKPSTSGFGLERTGARVDERGHVVTDARLRAAETVWAAGDCTAQLKFTHVGYEQGRKAARNAFRPALLGETWKDPVVPWVTFTDPEVGRVGLTEAEAAERYGDRAFVSTVHDTESDRGRAAGETDGLVKLVALHSRVGGKWTSKLLGMTVVSPTGGEQVAQGALALQTGMLLARLSTTIAAYPTWNLTVRLAAARFFGTYGGEQARPARRDRGAPGSSGSADHAS